jgi:hypothetical protein
VETGAVNPELEIDEFDAVTAMHWQSAQYNAGGNWGRAMLVANCRTEGLGVRRGDAAKRQS